MSGPGPRATRGRPTRILRHSMQSAPFAAGVAAPAAVRRLKAKGRRTSATKKWRILPNIGTYPSAFKVSNTVSYQKSRKPGHSRPRTRRILRENSLLILLISLLQFPGLAGFGERFVQIRSPGEGVGGRGGVHAEIPHVEVHRVFSHHLGDGVFPGRKRFGGRELDPASGHGGDGGCDETFVGFCRSSDRGLDGSGGALAAFDLDANNPEAFGGRQGRRFARGGLRGCMRGSGGRGLQGEVG